MGNKPIQVTGRSALIMVLRYTRRVVGEQVRAVAFVVVYLLAFLFVIFGSVPTRGLVVAAGIALVVFGLAFFLEGIRIGLMPLGERVGIQLPRQGGVLGVLSFGILLGVGATFAEPAIATLTSVARGVIPWQSPILFFMIETNPHILVLAISGGVGLAVALGLMRFYIGLSLKPFILTIIPFLLLMTLFISRDPRLAPVLGLAWDSGAVTTGTVTVPLVLALGIGVARGTGRTRGGSAGFGVVMLASSIPVLVVILVTLVIGRGVPAPMTEGEFFSPDRRGEVERLFRDTSQFEALRLEREARAIAAANGDDAVTHPEVSGAGVPGPPSRGTGSLPEVLRTLVREARGAGWAVLPLAALLGLVLLLLLRDRPRYFDEVALGIVFAVIGMTLLSAGISLGLSPLGDDIGRQIPTIFPETSESEQYVIIPSFNEEELFSVIDPRGERRFFFFLKDGADLQLVEFDASRYDRNAGTYQLHLDRSPEWHEMVPFLGVGLVLLFAFGLGFGSSLAEPGLSALALTVEELTVGTVRRWTVVFIVAAGVGIGLVMGVSRIILDISLMYMLIPPYVFLLPITLLGEEDMTSIAWDCGGVTTGPVTVPLVISLGLGLGSVVGRTDSFGILALASVYPILAMQIYALVLQLRERRSIASPASGGEA